MAERPDVDKRFLTVADVARILKLNQQTVRNWIDRRELPAIRVGRRVRIRRSEFDSSWPPVTPAPRPPPRPDLQVSAEGFWDGTELPTPSVPGARDARER